MRGKDAWQGLPCGRISLGLDAKQGCEHVSLEATLQISSQEWSSKIGCCQFLFCFAFPFKENSHVLRCILNIDLPLQNFLVNAQNWATVT